MMRWGSQWGWNGQQHGSVEHAYEVDDDDDDETSEPEVDDRKRPASSKKRKANDGDHPDQDDEDEKKAAKKELDRTLRFLRTTEGIAEATREVRQCMQALRARDKKDPLLERLSRTVLLLTTAKERLRADATVSRRADYIHKRTKRLRPSLIEEEGKNKEAEAEAKKAAASVVAVVATNKDDEASEQLLKLAKSTEVMDPEPANGKMFTLREAVQILKTQKTTTGTIRRWKKEGKLTAGLARVQEFVREQRDLDMMMATNPPQAASSAEKTTTTEFSAASADQVDHGQGPASEEGHATQTSVAISEVGPSDTTAAQSAAVTAEQVGHGKTPALEEGHSTQMAADVSEASPSEKDATIVVLATAEESTSDQGSGKACVVSNKDEGKNVLAEEPLERATVDSLRSEHDAKVGSDVHDKDAHDKKRGTELPKRVPELKIAPMVEEYTAAGESRGHSNEVAHLPASLTTTTAATLNAVTPGIREKVATASASAIIVRFDQIENPMDRDGNEPPPQNGIEYDMFEAVSILKFKEHAAPMIQKWILAGTLKCSKTTAYNYLKVAGLTNMMPRRGKDAASVKMQPIAEMKKKKKERKGKAAKALVIREVVDPEPSNGKCYNLFEAISILKTKPMARKIIKRWIEQGKVRATKRPLYEWLRKEKATGEMPEKGLFGDEPKRKRALPVPKAPREVDRVEDDPEPLNGKHYTVHEIVTILLQHKKYTKRIARWVKTEKILCSTATVRRAMQKARIKKVMPRKGHFGNVIGNRSIVDMSKIKEFVGLTTFKEIKAKLCEMQKQDLEERGLPMTRFKEPASETVKNYMDLIMAYAEDGDEVENDTAGDNND
jgi:hypothetical protein